MIQWTYKNGVAAPGDAAPRAVRRRVVRTPAFDLEDQRRLMLRAEVAVHNKKLASAAKACGLHDSDHFREFQNEGYRGLYGGLTAGRLRARRNLPDNSNVLDHMGSTELAANLFRMTQTEDKLRRGSAATPQEALFLHRLVGAKVRETIRDLGGVLPEDLPAQESITIVKRRARERQAQEKQAI